MNTRGRHLLIELTGCSAAALTDRELVRAALREAVAAAGATVVSESLHGASPHGVTAIVLLAESHISIHTRPEASYAAVDVYTCGACRPDHAVPVLARHFEAEHVETMAIERGLEGGARRLLVKTHCSRSAAAPIGGPFGPSLRATVREEVT